MKIRVECSPLKLGVDNALLASMRTNQWGLRLSCINEENTSRFEFVLDKVEAKDLILKIQKSLDAMDSITEMNKDLHHEK